LALFWLIAVSSAEAKGVRTTNLRTRGSANNCGWLLEQFEQFGLQLERTLLTLPPDDVVRNQPVGSWSQAWSEKARPAAF